MGTNIYDISEWKSGEQYKVNDIIWYVVPDARQVPRKYYWYCVVEHDASTSPSVSNFQWAGVKYDGRTGNNKPHWFWKPSYNFTVDNRPRVNVHKFGDGYEQRTVDGLESVLLRCALSFETRDLKESRAMAHFLHSAGGKESFILMLPPPYNIEKLYVARDWGTTFNFYDNYTVRLNIEEVTN